MLRTIAQKLSPEQDAVDLLKADHRKVEALFKEFNSSEDKRTRKSLSRQICTELDIHARIEEKVLYPSSKDEAHEEDVDDSVNEGIVEHEGIKRLIKQLSTMNASDEFFDSRMKVLEEYVEHHVKEEESSMFPKIIESGVDVKTLGDRLVKEKEKLTEASSTASRKNAKAV